MKSNKTKVRFYVEPDGHILAVFPYKNEYDGMKTCYAHIGQHSQALPIYYKSLPIATHDQYTSLANELTSIGYELEILNK